MQFGQGYQCHMILSFSLFYEGLFGPNFLQNMLACLRHIQLAVEVFCPVGTFLFNFIIGLVIKILKSTFCSGVHTLLGGAHVYLRLLLIGHLTSFAAAACLAFNKAD